MGFVCSTLINPPASGFFYGLKSIKSSSLSISSCWIPSPELSVCHTTNLR
nr:MAG TPA: hypothetical protein [Caudoviricetes sp.]